MSSSITCPQVDHDSTRGLAFIIVDWPLETLVLVSVALRAYSRFYLTRSFGSDDFMIIIAAVVVTLGTVGDQISHKYGFGRHCAFLSGEDLGQILKWTYYSWMCSFISYFFVRASVQLFTLRLLPRTKNRSQWIIYVAFFLNFAITCIVTISFGVQCQPFSAVWNKNQKYKCIPSTVLDATNKVNGILACIIDIVTACIPAMLLWKVQMKRTTKVILDVIFALGLITAVLSIGRAATITHEALTVDFTWNIVLPLYFGLFESKVGIFLACCPALRQIISYYHRTKTILPSADRQAPNADFSAMRHRVNLRDWVWRGKRDPMRAQGLINAGERSVDKESLASMSSGERFGRTGPEDSPLSEFEQRVVQSVSQV